jgi:hypothetical protein
MSRKDDRVRGTILHLLDADKTTKFIKEYLETDADIHAEPINYYGKNGNSGYLDVTPEELAPLISNETMDLADFIRAFGDRLENNFYAWVQYAKSHDQKMSVA